jgi:hypothetical protein
MVILPVTASRDLFQRDPHRVRVVGPCASDRRQQQVHGIIRKGRAGSRDSCAASRIEYA